MAIRLETPSYWAALGVWVVRESVRKALQKKMEFLEKSDLTNGARQIGKIKFNFDISKILEKSRVLNEVLKQKRLQEFF